jgi:cell division septation protein DedD
MLRHEETTDGAAGVEVESHAPERQQPLVEHQEPLVLDAVAVVEESAPAAAPAQTPDFYAVGVRLIKMSPVWLLTVTGGFALLILLLSWVRPGVGEADAAPIPNDAKSVAVQPRQPQAAPSAETPAAPLKEEHKEVAPKSQPAEPVEVASAKPAAAESKPAGPKKEPARVSTSADESGAKFTVQVGSFSATSQANERISSLRAAGFDARSTAVEIPGRGTWHRVQVGRFREREEAAKVAARLREKAAASGSMVVAIQ